MNARDTSGEAFDLDELERRRDALIDDGERVRNWIAETDIPEAVLDSLAAVMNDAADAIEESKALAARLREAERERDEAREKLAAWMIERSFATGHGDTLDDLLSELAFSVAEIRAERDRLKAELAAARAAALEEAAKCCDAFDGPVSDSDFVNGQATAAQQIRAAILAEAQKDGG